VGAKFSAPVQTGPGAHPASCTMGTGSFPRVKSGRSVKLTPHLLLVPWSRKGRAITLISLWAIRPVQSLSACTRVKFIFTLLWMSDQLVAQAATYTTHNRQKGRKSMLSAGFERRDPSNQPATDLGLRPQDHRKQLIDQTTLR